MSEKIFIWCYLTTATTCRVWVKPLRLSVYTKIQHSMQWTLSATAGCWSCLVLESIIPRVPVLAVLVNLRFLQLPASITKELFAMGLRRLFSRQEAASTGDLVPVFPIFPTVILEVTAASRMSSDGKQEVFSVLAHPVSVIKKRKHSACCLHHSWHHVWYLVNQTHLGVGEWEWWLFSPRAGSYPDRTPLMKTGLPMRWWITIIKSLLSLTALWFCNTVLLKHHPCSFLYTSQIVSEQRRMYWNFGNAKGAR